MRKIVIATRGSALALAQTKLVAAHLKAAKPGLDIELKVVTSTGDTITHVPLAAIAGQGVFTKELERWTQQGFCVPPPARLPPR